MKFTDFLLNQNKQSALPPLPAYEMLKELQERVHHSDCDGLKYFEKGAVERAYKQNAMSRETVIHISPTQFLLLASKLEQPNPAKQEKIQSAIDSGSKLSDLPYLSTTTNKDGNLEVDGHEGRHRMLALKELNISSVPVILISGDQGHKSSYRWGSNHDRPQHITGQDSRVKLPMPNIETF